MSGPFSSVKNAESTVKTWAQNEKAKHPNESVKTVRNEYLKAADEMHLKSGAEKNLKAAINHILPSDEDNHTLGEVITG